MMEKTLILKHISRMLCLLISYSKFTRTTTGDGLHPIQEDGTIKHKRHRKREDNGKNNDK